MRTVLTISPIFLLLLFIGCKDQTKSITEGHDKVIIQNPYPGFAGEVHEITLFVNTTEINNGSIDENADFRQPYYISNEDYTTYVNPGDIVIWRGVSTTDTLDIVNIERIKHIGGRKFLGKPVIQGNKGYPELVVALIQKNNNPGNIARKDEKYDIMFTIYRDSAKQKGPFKIDPKLEMPPE